MSICIINFSGRENGNCAAVARFIHSKAGGKIFSAAGLVPCGKCNYECLKKLRCPIKDALTEIMDTIAESDMTYFVLPNYCGWPCANFFIFNERSCGWFGGSQEMLDRYLSVPKQAIILSNTETDHIETALAYHSSGEINILVLDSVGEPSTRAEHLALPGVQEKILEFIK